MTKPNPYEANFADSELQVPSQPPPHPKLSGINAAVLAELGVRLLGLMFVVDGISLLVSTIATLLAYNIQIEMSLADLMMDPVSVGGIGSAFAYLLAGVYLLTKGRTVIELILMTDIKEASDSDAAE